MLRAEKEEEEEEDSLDPPRALSVGRHFDADLSGCRGWRGRRTLCLRRRRHSKWTTQRTLKTTMTTSRESGRRSRPVTQFYILGGAATCSEGFVICFLKVPIACLGSMAAAVQPNSLKTLRKHFIKPPEQVAAPPSGTTEWGMRLELGRSVNQHLSCFLSSLALYFAQSKGYEWISHPFLLAFQLHQGAKEGRTLSTERGVLSVARFCHVFP